MTDAFDAIRSQIQAQSVETGVPSLGNGVLNGVLTTVPFPGLSGSGLSHWTILKKGDPI